MQDTLPPITELVRHRPPMLLLDGLLAATERSARAAVTITPNSPFFQSPNGVPAWVGIEYMAQTVAAVAGWRARLNDQPVPTGYLLGTRRYTSNVAYFVAGTSLRVEATELMFDDNGLGAYNCRIHAPDLLASARLTVFEKPPDDHSP